jgi:indole-3-glycerol phosphate synthase
VAESGIETEDDVVEVRELGYSLALVGSSLVTSERPEESLAELIRAGRTVPTGSR